MAKLIRKKAKNPNFSNTLITVEQLAEMSGVTSQEIDEISKNTFDFYYLAWKPKMKYGLPQKEKDGTIKFRKISASEGKLFKIQKIIHSQILSTLKLHDYAFGGIKKKNNILNALQHCQSKYFFSIDLKDFFSSIGEQQVFLMLLNKGFSEPVAQLITKLVTYEGYLPQGAPTSPYIANLVFEETGEKIQKIIFKYDIVFSTFLDDLVFSSKKNFKFLTNKILACVKEAKFYINHKKITFKTGATEITGLLVKNGQVCLAKEMTERVEQGYTLDSYIRSINFIQKQYKSNLVKRKLLRG